MTLNKLKFIHLKSEKKGLRNSGGTDFVPNFF